MEITANSYFSGAGLFDIGFLQAGIKIKQSFEIDSLCCEIFELGTGETE